MKLFIVILIFIIIGCNHNDHIRGSTKKHPLRPIDTSIYTILKFDKANNYYFDKNAKPTTLSSKDIAKIEDLIAKGVLEYNRIEKDSAISITKRLSKKSGDHNFVWKGNFVENPSKYYKQLIPIINSKGEKEVWVNCFCADDEKSYWKKSVILVMDGGSCYFNLKINLTKGMVYDFMVNGIG